MLAIMMNYTFARVTFIVMLNFRPLLPKSSVTAAPPGAGTVAGEMAPPVLEKPKNKGRFMMKPNRAYQKRQEFTGGPQH